VPLSTLTEKFSHSRFEPSGMTSNRDIPIAKSIIDYIARWLSMTFIPGYRQMYAPKRSDDQDDGSENTLPEKAAGNASLPPLAQRVNLPHIAERLDKIINAVNKPELNLADRETQMTAFNGQFTHFQTDAPACDVCGSITVRNGNCYRCYNCGSSMGCS